MNKEITKIYTQSLQIKTRNKFNIRSTSNRAKTHKILKETQRKK